MKNTKNNPIEIDYLQINYGVGINFYSTLQIEDMEFESKTEALNYIKQELMNQLMEQISRVTYEDIRDWDDTISYYNLCEFEVIENSNEGDETFDKLLLELEGK